MSITNNLRVELRTRNNVLWHLIFDTYKNVAEFCRVHDLHESAVGRLLNLEGSPYFLKTTKRGEQGTPIPLAFKLSNIAGVDIDLLFPKELYDHTIPRHLIAEIPANMYRGLNAAKRLALPASQDDEVLAREARDVVTSVLHTLTPREERILRKHFGFGQDEQTLEEIAADEDVSTERIRQIQAKGLRKLRHPSRSRLLFPFVDVRPDDPTEPLIHSIKTDIADIIATYTLPEDKDEK